MAVDLPRGLLALPSADDTTLVRLTRKLRLLVLRRLLIANAAELAPPMSGAFRRLQAYLQGLARDKTQARVLLRVLGDVDVLVPLLCVESGQLPLSAALSQLVPTLLLSLSRQLPKRNTRELLLWDVALSVLYDRHTHKRYRFEPAAQGVLLDGPHLQVRTAAGADIDWPPDAAITRDNHITVEQATQPLFAARPRPEIAFWDTNPLSMLEEHPDKDGNAVDLGDREPADWLDKLQQAWALIELALPQLHRELIDQLQRVVPVGYQPERHLSASYREAPGLVYLTLHPSTLTMAEALIHECQHGKLNTLRWFDPILHNADSTWTESPVRPDMRPLMGVLLGVHAFVPVAALHMRLLELDHPLTQTPLFARRKQEVLAANRQGLDTLAQLGKPTPTGQRVLTALMELQAVAEAAGGIAGQ